eukprot:jgi/Chlat1/8611/Chrsp86S08005
MVLLQDMASGKRQANEWRHVKELGESSSKTTNQSKVECVYCKKKSQGGVTRIRAHLTGKIGVGVAACMTVPEDLRAHFLEVEEASIAVLQATQKKRTIGDVFNQQSATVDLTTETTKTPRIIQAFDRASKVRTDEAVARMFYGQGLPFTLVRSPLFKFAMRAVARFGPSYTVPSYNALHTTLLKRVKTDVDDKLIKFRNNVRKTGCTITSDGWTDVNSRPLLNLLQVSPDGAVFLDAVNTEGETKSAAYIARQIANAVELVGAETVVQVVTDSASACVSAGAIITRQYKHVSWSPCAAHVLDLLLEDIGKMPFFATSIKKGKFFVNFISNHHKSLAIFRSKTTTTLLKPGETRFASAFIMLQRLLEVKADLAKTVVDDAWSSWAAQHGEHRRALEPLIKVLRLTDGNHPTTGKLYQRMSSARETLQAAVLPTTLLEAVLDRFDARWKMMKTDLLCAGFVLDPEFRLMDQHEDDDVMSGFFNIVEKLLPTADSQAQLALQLSHTPELQRVAVRVLAQVTVASSCERNWSTYDFIHNKKRNKLRTSRARDLVWVFSNVRLLELISDVKYEEQFAAWDPASFEESDDVSDNSASEVDDADILAFETELQ